jgi:cysteine sulfinate desulfinase/cysteine desulfurase-like protein
LLATGLTAQEASASIRITIGRTTTDAEIAWAAKQMITVLQAHTKLV